MNAKRITALVLAGLMLVGTMGYIFSMIASAAEQTVGGYKANYVISDNTTAKVPGKISKGETVTFTITLSEGDSSFLGQSSTVILEACSFNGKNTSVMEYEPASAEIKMTLMEYSGTGNTLSFSLKPSSGSTKKFDLTIDECSPASSPDPDEPQDPDVPEEPTPSGTLTARYEVIKVKDGNGKTRFDADNPDKKADSSIRHGYTATIRAKVIDPNGSAEQIKASAAKIDISNFSGGSVKIITDDPVYPIKDIGGGVQYYLEFSTGKYSGSGKTLAAVVEGDDYYAEITASIAECVEYRDTSTDDDDDDYSDLAVATPYVIINSYGYGGREITAGETFTLSLTLYNTSANVDVQNMMVTVSMPDDLMLTSSSNTFYIANLATEESVTKSIQVTAKPAAKAQSHNIGVSMKYQYIDHHTNARRDNTTEETIAIPVVQVDRFQVTGIDAQAEINVGEEGLITVNFVNKGRSDVYNISAEISGNIQNPGQQQNLGNLTSGTTGTVDFYPIPLESGPVNGQVTITYEDTNMVEKTVTIDYSCTAISYEDMMGGGGMFDPGMDVIDPGMMGEGEGDGTEKSPAPWVIGGVAVAAVAAFIIKKKIDKKRSEAADADL